MILLFCFAPFLVLFWFQHIPFLSLHSRFLHCHVFLSSVFPILCDFTGLYYQINIKTLLGLINASSLNLNGGDLVRFD